MGSDTVDRANRAQREFLSFVKREGPDATELEILDAQEPNFLKDIFPWTKAPTMPLDNLSVPTEIAPELSITDTPYRDGHQAREPYTKEEMTHLCGLRRRLGGPHGRISRTEFFPYAKRDVDAVEECLRFGDPPKVTAWIRASSHDVKLFKETSRAVKADAGFELDETGILTSVSDHHLFYNFGRKGRKEALGNYLGLVEEILQAGCSCRCHFGDPTRAGVFRAVVPLARRLMRLAGEVQKIFEDGRATSLTDCEMETLLAKFDRRTTQGHEVMESPA